MCTVSIHQLPILPSSSFIISCWLVHQHTLKQLPTKNKLVNRYLPLLPPFKAFFLLIMVLSMKPGSSMCVVYCGPRWVIYCHTFRGFLLLECSNTVPCFVIILQFAHLRELFLNCMCSFLYHHIFSLTAAALVRILLKRSCHWAVQYSTFGDHFHRDSALQCNVM